MPNIYSRFDIVWPDASSSAQSSKSVDALSYGLATLCFPSRFAETARRSRGASLGQSKASHPNNSKYAKYIRKFSIGDGPSEWTSEYLITKESGKMLGTLVAIAVSKMINLETFVWDMPTEFSLMFSWRSPILRMREASLSLRRYGFVGMIVRQRLPALHLLRVLRRRFHPLTIPPPPPPPQLFSYSNCQAVPCLTLSVRIYQRMPIMRHHYQRAMPKAVLSTQPLVFCPL